MNIQDWHTRYTLQALWTRALRHYLCEKAHLDQARTVLEVGCGTGAVLASLPECIPAKLHGLDIDYPALQFAGSQVQPPAHLVNGDAMRLPYASASFDAVVLHYLLLWLPNPIPALQEMRRVLKPGGSLLVFAEPDYGGRIDYPEELSILGEWQSASLRQQGADPRAGRKIAYWLHQAGFEQIVSGVLGGEWTGEFNEAEFDSEWEMIKHDVGQTFQSDQANSTQDTVHAGQANQDAQGGLKVRPMLDELQLIDKNARLSGERVLYVPTFYALGFKNL